MGFAWWEVWWIGSPQSSRATLDLKLGHLSVRSHQASLSIASCFCTSKGNFLNKASVCKNSPIRNKQNKIAFQRNILHWCEKKNHDNFLTTFSLILGSFLEKMRNLSEADHDIGIPEWIGKIIIYNNDDDGDDDNFVEWQRSFTTQISAFRHWSLELETKSRHEGVLQNHLTVWGILPKASAISIAFFSGISETMDPREKITMPCSPEALT